MSQTEKAELDAAIVAVTTSPEDEGAWDRIEALAAELDCPDEVSSAYREALQGELSGDLAVKLGQRAARFHEEWFGEDPTRLGEILSRVIELDPRSEWAFQRLTVVYTVAEKWNELFEIYDRALEAADKKRRGKLLEEAFQSARDLANEPDRAIDYLQRLVEVKPSKKRTAQLERLLERHERWRDLLALWESRLEDLPPPERSQSRLRIAALWLDRLADPAQALEACRPIFFELEGDDAEPCALLERILSADGAAAEVREGALDLLRERYQERPREVIRVLEEAIPLFPPEGQKKVHRETGRRLEELDDHRAALEHYAALLRLDPASTAAQRALAQAAQISGDFERYARAVAGAAGETGEPARKVSLLADAARTRLELIEDEAGAIDLLAAALAVEGISSADVLTVGRRLNELLARAQRPKERLDVLERLAAAESVTSSRRALVGDIGRLAEELGETDRALAAWRSRLEADAGDRPALDAMMALLEREERWEDLIEVLERRAAAPVSQVQQRGDLVRIARIYDDLGRLDQAIEAWNRVRDGFGEDAETVEALSDLLSRAERWQEAADLLERASRRQTERLGARLVKLGEAYARDTETRSRALVCYRRALSVDPSQEAARAGLSGLLEDDELRAEAAESLARACRETGDWTRFLELVEPRLAESDAPEARLEILREAAAIQEEKIGDRAAALASLARAFPLAPRDRALESRLEALAAETGQWQETVEAYRGAIEAASDDPVAAAKLRFRLAEILERRLEDPQAAHAAYFAVAGAEPDNLDALRATVRLGCRLARWSDICAAVCHGARARGRIEPQLLDEIEAAAEESGAFADLCSALADALRQTELAPRVAADLLWRLAGWYRERLEDLESAEATLRDALTRDPDREEALRLLADLQRHRGAGRDLFETLRRLGDLAPQDLDLFREAAEAGVESEVGRELSRAALTALFGKASAAWRGTAGIRGESDPQTCVFWAVERLVDDYRESGEPRAALDLLMDASRLPFEAATRRQLRVRAAEIAAEIGDTAGAIEMYRAVLAVSPEDQSAADKLAALLEKEARHPELLALRRHELSLSPEAERRLELRLECARILGEIERHGGRLEVLRANLAERPGHDRSIEALVEVLDARSRHRELLDLLTEQAQKLEGLDEGFRAARLWSLTADIAEKQAEDQERALVAYRRVVALAPTPEALDALARLYTERGQPAEAVPWLEQRLAGAEAEERPRLSLALSRALLGAGKRDQAEECLARAIEEGAATFEVRALLADLYRESERWQPLAELIIESLSTVPDDETAVAWAREAAAIYHQRLHTPAKAIPALERALEQVPYDRGLRKMLAIGLRVAGNHEEARTLLEGLISEFGRRRSKERASIHVELAGVARAEGDLEGAVKELELASRMDSGNARISKLLAELARESGNLEQAERSLRALLLLVRRQPPGDDEEAVGVSEVLWDMRVIATLREDEEKAEELLESALEAAVQSDAEVRRLRRTLLAHGETELLLRALRQRLEASEEPESKASLLTDIGALLEGPLDRPLEALDTRLQALELAPAHRERHERARELAARLHKIERYVETVSGVVEQMRREEEAELSGRLLMTLGRVAEEDMDDAERARGFYARAEKLPSQKAGALFSLARICGRLGEAEEQTRALDELTQIAMDDESPTARADALYRLAEVQVASSELVGRGLSLLRQALDLEPRYPQASRILRAAAETEPEDPEVLALYGPVARASGDREMLLDFLERRARMPQATADQVKEAVDLAVELEHRERGEALLARAVEAARLSPDGMAEAVWAVFGLARQKLAAGAFDDARELLLEGAAVADPAEVQALGLELARAAAESEETLGLAGEVYEFLRQRDPGSRDIWEPLLMVYRSMEDADRVHEVVSATLPNLVSLEDRNRLRVQNASFLLEQGRGEEATESLRDALLDDPDDKEASVLLEEVLLDRGDDEGLADFLWQRFEEARERRSAGTVIDVALRLGALLDRLGSGDAASVFKAGLEVAPESRELLQEVLRRIPEEDPERADLTERLLAVSDEEEAPALALALCDLRETVGDESGARRALELGHQKSPHAAEVRARLEALYRQGDLFAPLAEMKRREAAAEESPERAVSRLREAAAIYRDSLSDLHAAAAVLREARDLDPSSEPLVSELASCLAAAGDLQAAVTALSEALGGEIAGAGRIDLLLLRADLRLQLADMAPALEDLEEAYALDAERATPSLLRGLEARRQAAAERGDLEDERLATLRIAELLLGSGQEEPARDLLLGWIERSPDAEALYKLRDLDTAAERWEGVVAATSRLLYVEEGEAQVDAATRLAKAASKLHDPHQARAGLEHVHAAQPESEVIRDLLRAIYQDSGADRELAGLLLADAEHADSDEDRYQAYWKAADILVNQLGDAEAAVVPAEKAREIKPEDHDTVLLLADILTVSGRLEEAEGLLSPAIQAQKRRSPELAALQYRMARLAGFSGDRDGQLQWLKKAFDVDRKDGYIAAELAHLATELGDYDLALKPLRAITLMDTPGPVTRVMALLWEAKIEHARGNRAKAEMWAKKALREDPSYQEAEQFLQEIGE